MKKIFILGMIVLLMGIVSCASETETTEVLNNTFTTESLSGYVNKLENEYNISLFVTQDMTTSMGINFELPSDVNGYVEYTELGNNQYVRAKASKKIRSFGEVEVYLYEYTMTNLEPGTTYEYRISNEDYTEVSPYYVFSTLTEDQDSYTFMFLADPQENTETGYMAFAYSMMSTMEFSQQDFQMVVSSGDNVNDRSIRSQWNMFFRYSSVYSFNVPLASAVGNHETPGLSSSKLSSMEFDAYMNLPNNGPTYGAFDELSGDLRTTTFDKGKTYSFDFGYAHIVVIDTEIYCDGTITCADYDHGNAAVLNNWVRNDLNNSNKEWKIVLLHRGPYGMSYDTSNVRESLVPILEECGVDLVLAGHEHQYSRAVYWQGAMIPFATSNNYPYGTLSLISNFATNTNFNKYSSTLGITYLTSNTASTKFYGDDMSSGLSLQYSFGEAYPVIPMVTIYENKIEVISYAMEKESGLSIIPTNVFVLEEFQIVK